MVSMVNLLKLYMMDRMKTKLKKLVPDFSTCFNKLKCTVLTDEETWEYILLLYDCVKPVEIAGVAMIMYRDRKVDEKKIVTKKFIQKLLPFCVNLLRIPTVGNIRSHINNLLIEDKNLHRNN